MSFRTSTMRAAYIIKEATYWLEADAHAGAFATVDSMTAIDLGVASASLRKLADRLDETRRVLIGNAPAEYQIAAE